MTPTPQGGPCPGEVVEAHRSLLSLCHSLTLCDHMGDVTDGRQWNEMPSAERRI